MKTIDLCSGMVGIRRGFELMGKFRNVISDEAYPLSAKLVYICSMMPRLMMSLMKSSEKKHN